MRSNVDINYARGQYKYNAVIVSFRSYFSPSTATFLRRNENISTIEHEGRLLGACSSEYYL